MERENYRLHIKYWESKNLNGWISDTDTVTFSDKWELEKYISGETAYNELDDAMKKRDDEILLYAENGKGEVVWRSEIMLAIQSVKDYLEREFGNERQQDFKNLSEVPIGYTTLTDNDVEIQFVLDMEKMEISTFIDGNRYPERIEPITIVELETLTFDELLAGWSGYVEEIYSFKMKTASYFHKIGGMDGNEIENFIRLFVQNKIDDARMDALITGIAVTGSRCRGMENSESDLDVVVELATKEREDVLFDLLHEDMPCIDGIIVDINPITTYETGSLAQYLPKVEKYLYEKRNNSDAENNNRYNRNDDMAVIHRRGGRR